MKVILIILNCVHFFAKIMYKSMSSGHGFFGNAVGKVLGAPVKTVADLTGFVIWLDVAFVLWLILKAVLKFFKKKGKKPASSSSVEAGSTNTSRMDSFGG